MDYVLVFTKERVPAFAPESQTLSPCTETQPELVVRANFLFALKYAEAQHGAVGIKDGMLMFYTTEDEP